MENSQSIPTSALSTISAQPDSSRIEELVRQRIIRLAECIRKDGAPYLLTPQLVDVWVNVFQRANVPAALADAAFDKAERTLKFWPAPAEVLSIIEQARETATDEAAEQSWHRVLDIRRLHWNPDVPGPFHRALAKLSDRERQAARAAGVFRDFESVEALHTWAKKRFIESFARYGELEQDRFLLPDGELKKLFTGAADRKALPSSQETYEEMRERGLQYSEDSKTLESKEPTIKQAMLPIVCESEPRSPIRSLAEQKRILREKGFLPQARTAEAQP